MSEDERSYKDLSDKEKADYQILMERQRLLDQKKQRSVENEAKRQSGVSTRSSDLETQRQQRLKSADFAAYQRQRNIQPSVRSRLSTARARAKAPLDQAGVQRQILKKKIARVTHVMKHARFNPKSTALGNMRSSIDTKMGWNNHKLPKMSTFGNKHFKGWSKKMRKMRL